MYVSLRKGPARLQTGHGKGSKATFAAIFYIEKCEMGKFNRSILKTISFETFISWEIVARKTDFAASEQ